MKAAIKGIGTYLPPDLLTNQDLEKMVDTNDEWITSRTGIQTRHILKDPSKATSDMGAGAVLQLLEKTNTKAEDIELIICATVTADMKFPDTANTIATKTKLKNAFGFDINAACSGFLYALQVGTKFIETGTHKKVIVVGADQMSSIIDYEDRATCIIFGDAAGAVLLEPSEEHGVENAILRADGAGREFLHMKAGGSLKPPSLETIKNKEHFVYQDGKHVFKHAVAGMSSAIKDLLILNKLGNDDISWVVPHQANKRIIDAVAHMLDFPMDKVMCNIHKYGNTTAATLPLCLSDYENQLKKGDKIILTAFGGGFTWGALLLSWAYE